MRTRLECIPCFFKQAIDAAALAGATKAEKKKIIKALARRIERFDRRYCPTVMGRTLYALVRKISKTDDPFKQIKRQNNEFALRLYPRLKQKVASSKDKLRAAIELAIAGNIIDHGIKHAINIEQEIDKIFAEENQIIAREDKAVFDYPGFRQALKKVKKVLYLGDNAGEIVFDRILIEQLNKEVTYVVRGKPIINDALMEDALFCGLNQCARVISSGSDAPGTVLEFCTPGFRRIYQKAELIISKGQGNFEALDDEKRPIFFLFRAKCPVVARHLKCKLGDIILKKCKV